MKQVQSKTLEIKKEIINKLVSGSTFREVRKYLQDTYNYHQRSADKLIAATSKELREHYEKYADNMAAYNLTRLTEIINECQEEGKYNELLKVLIFLTRWLISILKRLKLKQMSLQKSVLPNEDQI